jgi:hypothetical protein
MYGTHSFTVFTAAYTVLCAVESESNFKFRPASIASALHIGTRNHAAFGSFDLISLSDSVRQIMQAEDLQDDEDDLQLGANEPLAQPETYSGLSQVICPTAEE